MQALSLCPYVESRRGDEPDVRAFDSIVFVHGLTGNRENTWTGKSKNENIFWPKDLLSKHLCKARIISYGYDADIVGAFHTASSNTIRDHGKSLAIDLARWRCRTGTVNVSFGISFVANDDIAGIPPPHIRSPQSWWSRLRTGPSSLKVSPQITADCECRPSSSPVAPQNRIQALSLNLLSRSPSWAPRTPVPTSAHGQRSWPASPVCFARRMRKS